MAEPYVADAPSLTTDVHVVVLHVLSLGRV